MMTSREQPQTAADWAARLRSEAATPQDHGAYESWLRADPENRASAARLDQIWQSVGVLEDDPMIQSILVDSPRRERQGWQMTASRLAAALLLGISLAVATFFTWRYLDSGDSYETASGEQRVVDLADGSRLHLNVTTRLEVDLENDMRGVRLLHGQAFFEVVPDSDRPFVVTAGDTEISVLGTKFDVSLHEAETRVTVIEGRVAVTSRGSTGHEVLASPGQPGEAEPGSGPSEDPGAHQAAAGHRLELVAGDAIAWSRSTSPSSLESTAATASVAAWREGRVVFDSTPLAQAVTELDRYTPVKVRLGSAEIGSMAVSGVFYLDRLAEVESLVFALENSLPIVVERRDDELLLLASD